MADVVISGYYGFGNAGDEAILAGITQSLSALQPGLSFVVLSGDPAATGREHGLPAISRTDARAVWAAIGQSRLVISGGGSLLQDVTSPFTLPYYLGVVAMGLLRRRPVACCAQGIGPVQTALGRLLLRSVVSRVPLVTVRDADSAATLAGLGVRRPQVVVTADAALALAPGQAERGRQHLAAAGLRVGAGTPLIGVSVRAWERNNPHLFAALAAAVDRLAQSEGGAVVLIPMQSPGDLPATAAVRERLQSPALVFDAGGAYRQVLDVVAALDVMVGLRYHALVFAAMAGVPPVGISYDPKVDGFLRSLGDEPAGTTAALSAEQLERAARAALQQRQTWAGRVSGKMAALRAAAAENARLTLALLGSV